MELIDEITTVRFSGRQRLHEITVIAEVLEDPVRARLLVNGIERKRKNLPARFDIYNVIRHLDVVRDLPLTNGLP